MECPPRLADPITDPRAWNAATADAPATWYFTLPEVWLVALERAVRDLRRNSRPATEVSLGADDRADLTAVLEPVLDALETGRGFAIIRGVPLDRYTPQEAQAVYWLVGQALGCSFAQNVQGTLLYDVRDTGQDVSYGARFSVTNAESTFHTDNSFGEEVLDYVGLLCLRTARAGGRNQVVSGYTVHNELLEHDPETLEILYQPFHVDRRGGVKAGEAPTVLRPIFEWDGQELTIRYLRYWIEAGHQKIGAPLARDQIGALDRLDEVLRRSDLQVEFGLRPGEMFFINNRWIFHNRTAFEDHHEPDLRRHLVRLWLKAPVAARLVHEA